MSNNVTDPQPILFFCWLGMGMISLLASIAWLIIEPGLLTGAFMRPEVIAWVHLVALGWLCSLYFAAGYQLIPVVTLRPLASRWMSRIHLVFHGIAFPAMVIGFFTSRYIWVGIGGSIVYLGFWLFTLNSLFSSGLNSTWNRTSVPWFLGLFWLVAGGTLAVVATFYRINPQTQINFFNVLGLHVHTMLVGFFFTILISAASKLVPMFLLSPEKDQWGTWISSLTSTLILFLAYTFADNSITNKLLTCLMLIALLAHFGQMLFFILKKRKKLDPGMLTFFLANLLLLPAWWCFCKYHSNPAEQEHMIRAGVFIMLFLVFNGCILGMAQKIVPFMFWHHIYAKHLGKAILPVTHELLTSWTLWPIAIGFTLSASTFCIALSTESDFLFRPAAVILLVSYFFVVANGPKLIRHWKTPDIKPFPKPQP
ncbi:MAG: hypothetical protein MI748_13475 [Opitutales bacterium]|nr:hypothetical protein [Opitutales bacterium]